MTAEPRPIAARKSGFVTVVGWIFAVGSGMATAISALQNIVFHTMLSSRMPGPDELVAAGMPPAFRVVFSHFGLLLGTFFVLSLVTLAVAIGLLRRRNWARVLFIGILGLGIAWNLAGIGLQQVVAGFIEGNLANAAGEFQAEFRLMLGIVRGLTVVFSVGLSVLFGWMIKRLLAHDVRAEFRRSL